MAEHTHHEAERGEGEDGDFWLQIEGSPGNASPWEQSLSLSTSGNIANGTILTTLLFAYLGYHARLLAHHQCRQPDGRLVEVHRHVLDLLETALDQTAHLMDGCDEAPEDGAEDDRADEGLRLASAWGHGRARRSPRLRGLCVPAGEKVHIPSLLVVECVTAHRKPPEVRICRLSSQSRVGTLPPS
ncbi:MAG TPA: hypothetical protein VI542_29870, partial [Candidatus Tectomicrobia bacterium]